MDGERLVRFGGTSRGRKPRAARTSHSSMQRFTAHCISTCAMKSKVHTPAADLVEHWIWTRRLAGHLVSDSALADDLAQDAWLRASRHPDVEPSRGFLGSIVRNLVRERVRGERHRADRERRSASHRTSPAPDEILAAAETGQALAAAVLELPEPVRDVLLMRYFEGLSATSIAEALNLPEGTVRSRIKRGLDALRARFEGPSGRSRLMALAGVPGATAVGVANTSAWTALRVLGLSTAVAAVVYTVLALVPTRAGEDVQVAAVSRQALDDETSGQEDLALLTSTTRRGAVEATSVAAVALDVRTTVVTGTLVDEWHRPIEGASVLLNGKALRGAECHAMTAADGTFRLESEFTPDGRALLQIDAGRHRADRRATFETRGVGISRALEAGVRDLGEIIVPPRGSVRARVVNALGEPLPDFRVVAQTVSGSYLGAAKTSTSGEAHLGKLPAGSVRILAMDDWDRVAAETEIDVIPGLAVQTENLINTLSDTDDMEISDHSETDSGDPIVIDKEPVTLRGRIVLDGAGVADVPVLIRRLHGRDASGNALALTPKTIEEDLRAAETLWHGAPEDHVRTDTEGWFELRCDLIGSACELIASTESHHVRMRMATGVRGDVELGKLTLLPNANVTLRDLAPEGLKGWEFECRPATLNSHVEYASDGDGLLRLPPMPAGLHTLSLRPIRDRLDEGVSVKVDLQPGESRTIEVDARAFGMCRVALRTGGSGEPFPRGDVIFAPEGVQMPFRVTSSHRHAAAFEAVPWQSFDAPEKTVFVRAIGLTDVGFVDRVGRSVRFGDRPVDLRSGGRVDVTLDLGRTAALDLLFPSAIIPPVEGVISIECAGGTTLLPVRDGRLEPVAWGVDTLGAGRLRIRGLAAGEAQVRVRITDMGAPRERPSGAGQTPAPVPASTLEATVTLTVGRVVTLDLADIPVLPEGGPR